MFATPDLKPFIFQSCNNFETSKYALKTRQLYFPTSGKEVVARFVVGSLTYRRHRTVCGAISQKRHTDHAEHRAKNCQGRNR